MRKLRVLIALGIVVLGGCATFYATPPEGKPAATIVEKENRKSISWWEFFAVSTVDEVSVSHMGTSLGKATIRIEPGTRRILIRARYLHRESAFASDECPCEALFPIQIDLRDGQKIRLDGEFDGAGQANLRLVDLESQHAIGRDLIQPSKPVPKTSYVPMPGGGYMPVQSR